MWFFFPIRGLRLEACDGLDDPLFGDATLVSAAWVADLPQGVGSDVVYHRAALGDCDLQRADQSGVTRRFQIPTTDSFVAVRRTVVAEESIADARAKAVARAEEVVALLALSYSWGCRTRTTFTLATHVVQPGDMATVNLGFDRGALAAAELRHRNATWPAPPKTYSLAELRAWWVSGRELARDDGRTWNLSQDRALVRMLASQGHTEGPLAAAAITLVHALHAPNPEHRLLGSVSMMEVLLGTPQLSSGKGFQTMLRRARILVSFEENSFKEYERTVQARHRYIHQLNVDDRSRWTHAFDVAVTALHIYADLVSAVGGCARALRYIDFMIYAREVEGDWTDAQQETFWNAFWPTLLNVHLANFDVEPEPAWHSSVAPLLEHLGWTLEQLADHLSPFEVRELRAEGSQGLLFDVESDSGSAVLKLPCVPGAFDARFETVCDELRHEADVLRRFRGDGLVELEAFVAHDDVLYLVTRTLGRSLDDLHDATDEVPLATAFHVMADVATALSRIHAGGGAHNDINPANVLEGPDGWTLIDPSGEDFFTAPFTQRHEQGRDRDLLALARTITYVVFDEVEIPDGAVDDDDDLVAAWSFLRYCLGERRRLPTARGMARRARQLARVFEAAGQ